MRLRRFVPALACALLAPFSLLAAQAAPRPQPYCIRGVSLDRAGEVKGTLILRDGAIAAILDEAAPAPPGTRVIDGTGLLCLPAFIDAFSQQGCTVPQPRPDQDIAPDLQADVGVDMRLANRKGIQPGFRAVEALAITKDQSEAWRKHGFGAVLVAPAGELLAGSSSLATTREAAMRDLVMRDEVFAHAAFAASGQGYPSTLMGYHAQLRQFFLDSQRQDELTRRYLDGRPGARPPFDAELEAGALLVTGGRRLVCEAKESDDIERWLGLADEFGLEIAIADGLEAWRVTDLLAERDVTVVLTLDWGKEVKDPRPKDEKEKEGEAEGDESDAGESAEAADKEPAEDEDEPEADEAWEYEEPYAVRLERRREWEQGRDCALRLREAGVRFVFGTAGAKPSELIERVRTLVEVGLPAEAALAALTGHAAEFLGVEQRLGTIAPGQDATFALWRADPLVDEDATAAWVFVDGFPSEFKEEKKKGKKGGKGTGPAAGIDLGGSWALAFDVEGQGVQSGTLVLEMEPDGSLSGTLEVASPMDGARVTSEVEGEISGDELELTCELVFGEFTIDTRLTATVAGDALTGESVSKGPWSEAPMTQTFSGTRQPE
jgi:hypothetical protein